MAIASLLAKIGTSDNVEIKESLDQLSSEFSFEKIGRAPARFDDAELMKLNAALLMEMPAAEAVERLRGANLVPHDVDAELFWETIKGNIAVFPEARGWSNILFGSIETPYAGDEDREYIALALAELPEGPYDLDSWSQWTNELKAKSGRKGRGLFMPLRKALTGEERGPEMNRVMVLLGEERCRQRLSE